MVVVIYSADRSFADELGSALEKAFDGQKIIKAESLGDLEDYAKESNVNCLIIDRQGNREAVTNLLHWFDDDPDNEPSILLLTDLLPDDPFLDSLPDTLVDIRSRTWIADNPEYLIPLLTHLLSTPQTDTLPLDPDLMTLFSDHALPMLLIDPDNGDILAGNDAAVDFYGYSHRELIEMTIQEINALDPDEVEKRRLEAKHTEVQHFIFPHRLRNGEIRTVEVNSTPITHDGRTFLFSIIQDITKRVTAEEDLRVARDHYERLAEQNIVGIYTVKDGRFTYVNPKMAEMFGVTPRDMSDSSIYDFIAEHDHELVRRKVAKRVDGTIQKSHYTFSGVHPDKEHVRFEAHGSTVETDDGIAIIGTLIEVTDREAYEAELRRLSLGLEATAHAVYITDRDSIIEYVNPAFEQVTGYSADEALGKTPAILNSGKMGNEYYERLYATIENGDVWEETVINQRKSGELYHAHQTISPFRDGSGDIGGYVAIQSDISQMQIQQQVLQVFQRIFRHNLRNQLNIIQGNADLVAENVSGTPLEKYAEDIEEAARSLESISNKAQIVESATDEIGSEVPTDLVALLREEEQEFSAQHPSVTFHRDCPSQLHVAGDERLEIAIHEIIQNAIEHTNHRPEIRIEVTENRDSSRAEVVFRDNGPGIDIVELTALETGEETPLEHGSGLGLWLVKWAITSIGGDVVFSHNDPRGLTVELSIPLASLE